MKPRVHLSAWNSVDAAEHFHAGEERLARERTSQMPAAIDVATRLGSTRAYRWDGEGEPVVFLHGATGTALTWLPYAERLAGRAMYAFDTMGDVGRSHQEVAVEGVDDLSEWLADVLTALGVDRVHLVGTSYGGFLALNLAIHRPERVRSLFLIEPAGVIRVKMGRFMRWGMASLFSTWLPGPLRRAAARRLRNPIVEDRAALRLGLYAARHFRSRLLRPEAFTDDELRSIAVPTRVFVGERSEAFPSRDVSARVRLMPCASVQVVPGGGHALALSHLDDLTTELAASLAPVEHGRSR